MNGSDVARLQVEGDHVRRPRSDVDQPVTSVEASAPLGRLAGDAWSAVNGPLQVVGGACEA